MTFFRHKPLAKSVEFDAESMGVELLDGRKIFIPLAYFPRFFQASAVQRQA